MASIDDLLNALQDPSKGLTGSASDIWKRINNKDSFEELNMDEEEKDAFIKEWIESNPYSAM